MNAIVRGSVKIVIRTETNINICKYKKNDENEKSLGVLGLGSL